MFSYMLTCSKSNSGFTPGRVPQVFEVSGDRNQISLNLQVHLSVQVGLDHLTHTHIHIHREVALAWDISQNP